MAASGHSAEHRCSHHCCGAARAGTAWPALSRRDFMIGVGTAAAVGSLALPRRAAPSEIRFTEPASLAAELVVQPVLTYELPERRAQTSWRNWGGIQSAAQVAEEAARIEHELKTLSGAQRLAVKFLPLARVRTPEEAAELKTAACDVVLVYAAGGWTNLLEALVVPERPTLFFLRHQSGPVYLWYEILHPRFLRKGGDASTQPGVEAQDVVVDDYAELAWRLRALSGLRRTLGQRIVAVGGAGGWGAGEEPAPRIARTLWKLDIVDVDYAELGRRIAAVRKDAAALADARRAAESYVAQPGVKLETAPAFVENAFVLRRVFESLMREHGARAITVQHCMGTIMPIAETTACLTLSLLNDDGWCAFCESDFVVIPCGLLMHAIADTPVFLNDPTWPHDGVVTIAHCTAPRRMDGQELEPATLLTHFESDYGAAPKVEMRVGQTITNVVPDFASQHWLGFTGKIRSNPALDICRSQHDIAIEGDWQRLLAEMRGFHWMTCYGDHCREIGYAARRLGIEWQAL